MNNSIGGVKTRRTRTLQRLENQLISGVKTAKNMELVNLDGSPSNIIATLPLTEQDITRINKEIAVLKTKI